MCSVLCMGDLIRVDVGGTCLFSAFSSYFPIPPKYCNFLGVYQHLGVDDQGLTPRVVDQRIAMTMMIIRKINIVTAALVLETGIS